jgi:phage tail-like protein
MKSSQIKQLLPRVFQAAAAPHTPLDALLHAMEALHAPAEERLAAIEAVFNAHSAPDGQLAYLARWVDLDRFFPAAVAQGRAGQAADALSTGNGRLRELIAAAAYLSQWRGTLPGLQLFLETATGLRGFGIEERVIEQGRARPYHIRVTAPAAGARDRSLIASIIEQEKPAHVTFELVFA